MDLLRGKSEARGFGRTEGARRSGKADAGDRSSVSAERGGRRASLHRNTPCSWQSRYFSVVGATCVSAWKGPTRRRPPCVGDYWKEYRNVIIITYTSLAVCPAPIIAVL